MLKVKTTGFRELDKALSALPQAVAKQVLKKVGTRALEPLAARAAALAPERLGKLAFSISISTRPTRRAEWKSIAKKPGVFAIAMGPGAGLGALYYATHVEFGTVDTPAKPFMRPAWDGGKSGLLEAVKDGLTVEIARATKLAARRGSRAKTKG